MALIIVLVQDATDERCCLCFACVFDCGRNKGEDRKVLICTSFKCAGPNTESLLTFII